MISPTPSSPLPRDSGAGGATLEVRGLTTQFVTREGVLNAVDGVSFSVQPGKIMGLVGESGSGKSMTAYSIMGLVDAPGRIVGGEVIFRGKAAGYNTNREPAPHTQTVEQDLRTLSPEALRAIRGNRISMIFQDPMMTLNPVLRIDTQMIEAVQAHRKMHRSAAREIARDALVRVGIAAPDERLLAYPHQFSGGMRQRVAIAIALLNQPDLIICDEPTTALDVTIQAQILGEMQTLCRETGTALIWITHDLAVVAGLADTLAVMYAGRIVESGDVDQILDRPRHPYTHGLIASSPSRNRRGQPLKQIPGTPPSLSHLPTGCAFRDRCERADAMCLRVPPLEPVDGRLLRCFHPVPDLPPERGAP